MFFPNWCVTTDVYIYVYNCLGSFAHTDAVLVNVAEKV